MRITGQPNRQGDVLLQPVELNWLEAIALYAAIQSHAAEKRDGERLMLAYGEATGHHHSVIEKDVEVVWIGSERFLFAQSEFTLEHQEHDAIVSIPQVYILPVQKTYERGLPKRVID